MCDVFCIKIIILYIRYQEVYIFCRIFFVGMYDKLWENREYDYKVHKAYRVDSKENSFPEILFYGLLFIDV